MGGEGIAFWLWLAAGGLAALALGFRLGRRRTGTALGGATPSSGRLYALAEELEDFYRATAHPADLRQNEAFERCVQLLASDAYGAEQLLSYLSGDNTLIACMAACALQRRSDGAAVCERALLGIGLQRSWSL